MKVRLCVVLGLVLVISGTDAGAQSGFGRGPEVPEILPNPPYDGRLAFARLSFTPSGGEGGFMGRVDRKWDHDYPRAERHLMQILQEITSLRPLLDASNVHTLDDPELHKYPVSYMSEPGFWRASEAEAAGLRSYLLKGGFVIFDDFAGPSQWYNFEQQMRRVMPDGRLVLLDRSHPIFDSFYRIESLAFTHPYYGVASEFYGMFEDNDPSKRLLLIANFNNDIGDLWEFSDTGFFSVDLSNEAYKLGVNYVVYGMTR
jgi:hypothetical protein